MHDRSLSNDEISLADIPAQDADWWKIGDFALTFDGYEHWGSFERCADVAQATNLASSLTELRTWLFFQQRKWRFQAEHPDTEAMVEILEFLGEIRSRVAVGKIE